MKKKETLENKIICPNCKKEIGIEVKIEAKVKALNGGAIKGWKRIEAYEYKQEGPDKFVELIYKDITNMHDVRIVETSSGLPVPEHQYNIKFTNGHGRVNENWVTKPHVTGGEWDWEVYA